MTWPAYLLIAHFFNPTNDQEYVVILNEETTAEEVKEEYKQVGFELYTLVSCAEAEAYHGDVDILPMKVPLGRIS